MQLLHALGSATLRRNGSKTLGVHFIPDRSPIGAPQQHHNEPPPRSWEIGAPFYIPLARRKVARSLSLIRKSQAGWEHIAEYRDDSLVDGATERQLPAGRSP
jgi:hypothetical protein